MSKLISNFGYTKVKPNEKTKLVQKIFTDVSQNYDLMNDLMSLGTHRIWKKKFVDFINPLVNDKIIDVGSGTGDIAKYILKSQFKGKLHLLDLNKEMLNEGKSILKKNENIFFHQGNAEKLSFKDNTFDKYTIAFCLRNVTNIEKSLNEALRVLKPGGSYYCLEFSSPNSNLYSLFYKNYRSKILPLMGKVVTKNNTAYKYLSESIELFPSQEKLKMLLQKIGFKNVKYIDIFNGIVSIHKGYKI